ncbi:MAG: DUF992 domain-containing protein [Pseudomonadota bacterium]
MKKVFCLLAGLAAATLLPAAHAHAQGGVEVGVLECQVTGGSGFIVATTKDLTCEFKGVDGFRETYAGTIDRFGIEIGKARQTFLIWGVFAPTVNFDKGTLSGTYVGVSGEATAGVGVGAAALIGGFNRSITLNPISLQSQQGGLNIAAGVASLRLSVN